MEAGGSYLRTALWLHNKPPLKLLVKTVSILLPPMVLGCPGSAAGVPVLVSPCGCQSVAVR